MFPRLLVRLACASLLFALSARGEDNVWPFAVERSDPRVPVESGQYLGPFFFQNIGPAVREQGFRPLYLSTQTGAATDRSFLYPFFTWHDEPGYQTFSFFQLVNLRSAGAGTATRDDHFDVWPFYFSRTAENPAESYRALFPLLGTIKHRFGKDRIEFAGFPLYAQTEKAGKHVVHAPWPFLRFIDGAGHHGFEFWPLFGRSGRPGDYDRQFYLWPLILKSDSNLSEPVTDSTLAVLPFYLRTTGPGYRNETFVWPFFGYSHRTEPYHYDEQRYLWPFLVQGHGDQRRVNRWAPLYTHSVIKGYDKTWLLWPFFRHATWQADGVAQEKNQFLFFFYWSLEQRSLANPAAPTALKTHLWPLFSAWDNGAGRRQIQALSPFEVFFPNNTVVRRLWSPLFAVYRYDLQADTTARHALLWNAVTYEHGPAGREFHLGPLFSTRSDAAGRRVALGSGLVGLRQSAGGRWRPFLFDFKTKEATKADQAKTP
jgi:hypothetical protein